MRGAYTAGMAVINLRDKFELFSDHFAPRIVGELNGQQVKLVKLQGGFVMHSHAHEDELFMVMQGELLMHYEDRPDDVVRPGEFLIVPRGLRHCPEAASECWVMLFEPASTVNTGGEGGERTRSAEWL